MEIRSRLASGVLIAACALGVAGCSDGGDTVPDASSGVAIGPAGGIVAVASGPLAGASIVIPPGAISTETEIRIEADPAFGVRGTLPTAVNIEGTEVVGVPIRFEPAGLVLNQRATIRMPGGVIPDPTGGGSASTRRAKIVLNRPSTARIEEAFLTTSFEWQIDELGTVWTLSYGAELDFPVEQFMFNDAGETYDFEGFRMAVDNVRAGPAPSAIGEFELVRTPPVLPGSGGGGPTVLVTEDVLFLERGTFGELRGNGFATFYQSGQPVIPSQSFIPTQPLPLLPARIRADQEFGPFAVTTELPYRVEVDLGPREPFETPFGVFPDTIRLRLLYTSPAIQEFDLVLAFGQGVVGYGLSGGTGSTAGVSGRLVRGWIGTQPIPPR